MNTDTVREVAYEHPTKPVRILRVLTTGQAEHYAIQVADAVAWNTRAGTYRTLNEAVKALLVCVGIVTINNNNKGTAQ